MGAHVATKSFWKRGMASLWHQYHRLGSQKCVIHMHHSQTSVIRVHAKKGNMYVLTNWVGGPNWIIFISRSWRTDQVRHDLEIDHPLIYFSYLFYFEVNPPLESMPLEIVIAVWVGLLAAFSDWLTSNPFGPIHVSSHNGYFISLWEWGQTGREIKQREFSRSRHCSQSHPYRRR